MPNGNDVRSPVEIIQDVLRNVGDVVRAELHLARAEMTEKLQKTGKAGGFFAGAAICGFLAAASLAACIIAALALAMPVWLAALLTCLFLTCIAAALYHGAQVKIKGVRPAPELTVETMKDNLQWARQRTL
jgi:Putative Actinobacterial Holin-X, holin superfamily III